MLPSTHAAHSTPCNGKTPGFLPYSLTSQVGFLNLDNISYQTCNLRWRKWRPAWEQGDKWKWRACAGMVILVWGGGGGGVYLTSTHNKCVLLKGRRAEAPGGLQDNRLYAFQPGVTQPVQVVLRFWQRFLAAVVSCRDLVIDTETLGGMGKRAGLAAVESQPGPGFVV